MFCCVNCFNDAKAKEIIRNANIKGSCSFCNSQNVNVLDLDNDNLLSNAFCNLLNAYQTDKNGKTLVQCLTDDWHIFAFNDIKLTNQIIREICSVMYDPDDHIFTEKLSINVQNYKKFKILKSGSWNEFSKNLKEKNRFHYKFFNHNNFKKWLESLVLSISVDSKFYRARLSPEKKTFKFKEIGMPPKQSCKAGRINPEGIPVLYLADTIETVLTETRSYTHDYVCIATFKSIQELRLIDLSKISELSPLYIDDDVEWIKNLYVNLAVLKGIAEDVAKPLRRGDSSLDYIPTQFISEFIKLNGYDGVKFNSTLHPGGVNYALFKDSKVRCIKVDVKEVTSIDYNTKDIS